MIKCFTAVIFTFFVLSTIAHAQNNNSDGIAGYNDVVKIVLLGDGLYSGYGLLNSEESYANQLEKTLLSGYNSTNISVINYTDDGIGSASAIQFLPAIIAEKPDIVMVGLGYREALSMFDIETMYNNMDNLLTELYRNRIYVILLQPTLPQDIEHQYVRSYNDMFSKLVKRYDNVVYVNDFMHDIPKNPYVFDDSTRYPNEQGALMMLESTKEYIELAIKNIRQMRFNVKYKR